MNIRRKQSEEKHMLKYFPLTFTHLRHTYLIHKEIISHSSWADEMKVNKRNEPKEKQKRHFVCRWNVYSSAEGINFIRTLSNYDDLMQTTIFPKEKQNVFLIMYSDLHRMANGSIKCVAKIAMCNKINKNTVDGDFNARKSLLWQSHTIQLCGF